MNITIYSLLTSLFLTGVVIAVFLHFRKRERYIKYFRLDVLAVFLSFCVARMFFTVEFPFTKVIQSRVILPAIQRVINYPIFTLGSFVFNLVFVFYAVWFIVAAYFVVSMLRKHSRFTRFVSRLPACENETVQNIFARAKEAQGYEEQVKVIVHEKIKSPAIIGFFKPVIMLPDIPYEDEVLFSILSHEIVHHKKYHVWIKLFLQLFCAFYWWFPLTRRLSTEIAQAMEIHCDLTVTKTVSRKQYMESIITVVETFEEEPNLSTFACAFVSDSNGDKLKERFKIIKKQGERQLPKSTFVLSILLMGLVTLSSFAFVIQPYNKLPSISEPVDSGEDFIMSQNAYFVETEDGYDLYINDECVGHSPFIIDDLSYLEVRKQEGMNDEKN